MKKFYPSSSAFLLGRLVRTDYPSGCFRSILLSALVGRTNIHPFYSTLGAIHEDNYAKDLGLALKDKELPVRGCLSEKVLYSGRADFTSEHDGLLIIHETKATTSSSTAKAAIEGGQPKLNHLAQLVFYMTRLGTTEGRIAIGYYEQDGDTYVRQAQRILAIRIENDGQITIDGQPSGYTVYDQLAHAQRAAKVLENEEWVEDRPDGWDSNWGSPCSLCPFKRTCDRYDANELKNQDEVYASAFEDLALNMVSEPRIRKVRKK